jgi:transcriptional regulator with XRE-family HTH domain
MGSEIGTKVREARERRGLSMAEVARASGLSPGAVSRIEHGERSPGAATLARLARVLGVEVGHLIGSGDGDGRAVATVAPAASSLPPEVSEAISTVATIMPTLPLQGRQRVLRVLRAILDGGAGVGVAWLALSELNVLDVFY